MFWCIVNFYSLYMSQDIVILSEGILLAQRLWTDIEKDRKIHRAFSASLRYSFASTTRPYHTMYDQILSPCLPKPEFRIMRDPHSGYIDFPRLPEFEPEDEGGLLAPPVTQSNARRRPSFGLWLMYKICTTLRPEDAAVALIVYNGGRRKGKRRFLNRIKRFFSFWK